ncbi:hypothetical protein ABZ725_32520 [Streptomyces sp. NPDC006872]
MPALVSIIESSPAAENLLGGTGDAAGCRAGQGKPLHLRMARYELSSSP